MSDVLNHDPNASFTEIEPIKPAQQQESSMDEPKIDAANVWENLNEHAAGLQADITITEQTVAMTGMNLQEIVPQMPQPTADGIGGLIGAGYNLLNEAAGQAVDLIENQPAPQQAPLDPQAPQMTHTYQPGMGM